MHCGFWCPARRCRYRLVTSPDGGSGGHKRTNTDGFPGKAFAAPPALGTMEQVAAWEVTNRVVKEDDDGRLHRAEHEFEQNVDPDGVDANLDDLINEHSAVTV